MSTGDKLFARLLNRQPGLPQPLNRSVVPSVGLQLYVDDDGHVEHLSGPLRHLLAQQRPSSRTAPLLEYLLPHSSLAVEGRPADWQGQLLDLDFYSLAGPPLHLRGWVQAQGDGWLLQLLDIGDLLGERRQARSREQCSGGHTDSRPTALGSLARLRRC